MKSYRKPDQEYYDDFDSYTIKLLKEIEAEEQIGYPKTIIIGGEPRILTTPLMSKFNDKAILRSRSRESYVRERIREDQMKDLLVQRYNEPKNIKCDTCGTRMFLSGHGFGFRGHELLFLFDCPRGTHKSRKVIHPDGDELIFPKSLCKECGGEITTTSKEDKFITIISDKCNACGKENIMELDMTPDPPITEEDRKKYCIRSKHELTFIESIEAMADLMKRIEEKEAKEEEKINYEVDKIEKLTIPRVKERLAKITTANGFIDFAFEKPDMGRNVTVEFNLQDPTDRDDKESVKVLCKMFNESLFTTNWRLQSTSVLYRMGYLTGKLKGCENEEGLLKLAKEIKEKSSKNKK